MDLGAHTLIRGQGDLGGGAVGARLLSVREASPAPAHNGEQRQTGAVCADPRCSTHLGGRSNFVLPRDGRQGREVLGHCLGSGSSRAGLVKPGGLDAAWLRAAKKKPDEPPLRRHEVVTKGALGLRLPHGPQSCT